MRQFAILPLMVALVGCSGDDATPDAGTESSTLEILDPPGDSIGLPFAGDVELAVRYRLATDEPVSNVGVSFEIVAGASEDAGAATLSASIAGTSEAGVATVVLTAGNGEANFRVRASAPGAAAVQFFVVVSNSGFASLDLGVNHSGARPESDYQNIEYRLYDPATLDCAGLDIDAIPDSVLPPRSAPDLDTTVEITNLAAERAYTIVAWGENVAQETRLGVGCIELAPEQVTPGQAIGIALPFVDRPLQWSAPVSVRSAIVLTGLADAVDSALAPDPWRALACELGPAQLLIDCALDQAVDDGDLDCVVTGVDPLVTDVEALRGALDLEGCRPDEVSPGVPSLDRQLLDIMVAGPWTEENTPLLAAARDQLLAGLAIDSELSAPSSALASHRLTSVRVVGGGLSFDDDLTSSARPILSQPAIAASIDTGSVIDLTRHGFTLDLERTLTGAFDSELLAAFSLDARTADLGAALAESFGGCATFSNALCTEIARPASCVEAACTGAASLLDSRLRAWLTAIAASDLDFQLSGSARIEDRDFDLAVDTVGEGSASPEGAWTIELETSTETITGVGAFGGP